MKWFDFICVLALLAPNARLVRTLALSDLALACTQFAEPVLFGKVVDTLSGGQQSGAELPG
jgi:ATP-binding cassette subfamily B protein